MDDEALDAHALHMALHDMAAEKMVREEPASDDREQAGSIIARIRFEPGIRLVDGGTTGDILEELIRQLDDPESVLRQGKYGSRVKSLQIVTGAASGPHANKSATGMCHPPAPPGVCPSAVQTENGHRGLMLYRWPKWGTSRDGTEAACLIDGPKSCTFGQLLWHRCAHTGHWTG
jgi:hypothetical protein